MFQQIAAFFDSIPFFGSVPFALIAMVVVGSSWCLVGLVMGEAPKKGIEPSLVQLGGATFSIVCSTVIMLVTSAYSTATPLATFLTCLAYFAANVLNFIMLQMMSKAMQCGPNGVIWAIIQSSLVFPFIVGILFFGVEFTVWRGAGIVLLLAALALFGAAKEQGNAPRVRDRYSWRFWAFLSFACMALTQNLSTAPSYFEELRAVSPVLRSIASICGTVTGALLRMGYFHWRGKRVLQDLSALKRFRFWAYVLSLQFFGLLFAYTLLYPGMDAMARAGAGAVSYPLMVGSCIVSFSLYSIFVLHEKAGPVQYAALACCLVGLAGLCIPA